MIRSTARGSIDAVALHDEVPEQRERDDHRAEVERVRDEPGHVAWITDRRRDRRPLPCSPAKEPRADPERHEREPYPRRREKNDRRDLEPNLRHDRVEDVHRVLMRRRALCYVTLGSPSAWDRRGGRRRELGGPLAGPIGACHRFHPQGESPDQTHEANAIRSREPPTAT